jgi:hypothetical protein
MATREGGQERGEKSWRGPFPRTIWMLIPSERGEVKGVNRSSPTLELSFYKKKGRLKGPLKE